jgi:LytS/YehU family sensor histidine kinase
MLCAAVAVVLAVQAPPPTAGERMVKETAYARVTLAQAIARDSAILDAVKAKNKSGETMEQIRRKDAYWIANASDPLRQQIVKAPCSARVKALVKDDSLVVEAFVMDDQGALVCSINETSDYWQGDEAKWQETYEKGKETFVEEPAFDASTGTYAIQLSVPIFEAPEKRIGAVTLTLKLRR